MPTARNPVVAQVVSVQNLQTGAFAAVHLRAVQLASVHSHVCEVQLSSTEQVAPLAWGAKQRLV